jgi:hypothetical protein
MKGSTSFRRFCWLQVNFSYGHEAATSQAPTNGCSWPHPGTLGALWRCLRPQERQVFRVFVLEDFLRSWPARDKEYRIGAPSEAPQPHLLCEGIQSCPCDDTVLIGRAA